MTAIGGEIVRRIRIPRAAVSQVATGPGRHSLLISTGDGGGLGHIQRRDPVTGALLAISQRFDGVTLGSTPR